MDFRFLIHTLETEVDIYKNFKELEEGKTDVIIEGDVEKLDSILNTEQMLHMKLQGSEKKRIETMRNLGLADKTLTGVIGLAEGKDKEKLSGILEDLIFYTDAIKKINDRNTKLVKSRLDVIASVAKLFKEPKADGRNSGGSEKIYGKNAKVFDQSNEFETSVISRKI